MRQKNTPKHLISEVVLIFRRHMPPADLRLNYYYNSPSNMLCVGIEGPRNFNWRPVVSVWSPAAGDMLYKAAEEGIDGFSEEERR